MPKINLKSRIVGHGEEAPDNLTANPLNFRRHPKEQLNALKGSMKELGWIKTVIVNKRSGYVLDGHARVEEAIRQGLPSIPVTYVDLDENEEKLALAVLDPITELAYRDDETLKLLLEQANASDQDLKDFLLTLNAQEAESGLLPSADEDEVPEPPKKAITKLGDLITLGNHRLLCGDATKIEYVEKLMDGKKADMVFTDPPYGMKKENVGVLNDNLNYDDLLEFNQKWIPLSFSVTKKNGSWYCWGTDEPLMDIYGVIIKPMIKSQQATFRNLITWSKGHAQGQNSENTRSYAIADEKCLFVMCGVQGCNSNADNYFDGWESIRAYLEQESNKCGGQKKWKEMLSNHMGSHYFTKSQWVFPTKEAYKKMQDYGISHSAFRKEYDEIEKEYYATRAYFNNTHDNFNNVWEFDRHQRDGSEGGHATPKPIQLCERAIKSSSETEEVVLDLFGGSGSTLIACEKTNRHCYMMELDPIYCDVIIERWEKATGKKAIRP